MKALLLAVAGDSLAETGRMIEIARAAPVKAYKAIGSTYGLPGFENLIDPIEGDHALLADIPPSGLDLREHVLPCIMSDPCPPGWIGLFPTRRPQRLTTSPSRIPPWEAQGSRHSWQRS